MLTVFHLTIFFKCSIDKEKSDKNKKRKRSWSSSTSSSSSSSTSDSGSSSSESGGGGKRKKKSRKKRHVSTSSDSSDSSREQKKKKKKSKKTSSKRKTKKTSSQWDRVHSPSTPTRLVCNTVGLGSFFLTLFFLVVTYYFSFSNLEYSSLLLLLLWLTYWFLAFVTLLFLYIRDASGDSNTLSSTYLSWFDSITKGSFFSSLLFSNPNLSATIPRKSSMLPCWWCCCSDDFLARKHCI